MNGNAKKRQSKSPLVLGSSMNSLSSEEVNLFSNQINSFLVIDFSCVEDFGVSNKEKERRLVQNFTKSISFFPATYCFYFDPFIQGN